jgi:hypothetical protein
MYYIKSVPRSHRSARRPRVKDADIRHATDYPLVVVDLDPKGDLLMAEKTETYKTRTGKVLTDAEIEALAHEAERGYDVEALKARRRGRPMLGTAPAEVVPVRLDPDLKQAVEARAEAEHATTSEIIRRALRRFLDVA